MQVHLFIKSYKHFWIFYAPIKLCLRDQCTLHPSARLRNMKNISPARSTGFLPRLIRFRDAPSYLGMDRHRFNTDVRPYLIAIPIGRQGVAFDRLEMDAWVEQYKSCNGRPAKRSNLWDAKNHQASRKGVESGGSTRELKDTEDWQKAAARIISKKRSAT